MITLSILNIFVNKAEKIKIVREKKKRIKVYGLLLVVMLPEAEKEGFSLFLLLYSASSSH